MKKLFACVLYGGLAMVFIYHLSRNVTFMDQLHTWMGCALILFLINVLYHYEFFKKIGVKVNAKL